MHMVVLSLSNSTKVLENREVQTRTTILSYPAATSLHYSTYYNNKKRSIFVKKTLNPLPSARKLFILQVRSAETF